jgi:hypothetical protein
MNATLSFPEDERIETDIVRDRMIAKIAAQWGADQELEACCEWFVRDWTDIETADKLRAARRPKPPSLKAQALEALKHAEEGRRPVPNDCALIRRALASLPD